MVKIHMTFNDHQRIISFQKGHKVKELRYRFLHAFSDVLYDKVTQADIKFKRYDHNLKKYVDVNDDEKIENDTKMGATLTGIGGAVVLHPINENTSYRLWSPVSNGLLQRDTSDNSVNGNGSFGGSNTIITTSAISQDIVSLLFIDGTNTYVITQDPNGVTAVPSSPGVLSALQSKFKAEYYWSYTLFQTESDPTQYLGCDSNGNATLVQISSRQYPNPQALFILNEP